MRKLIFVFMLLASNAWSMGFDHYCTATIFYNGELWDINFSTKKKYRKYKKTVQDRNDLKIIKTTIHVR